MILDLLYAGHIGFDTSLTLRLSAALEGPWKKPFGLSFVTIAHLKIGVGINLYSALPSLGEYPIKLTVQIFVNKSWI